MHSFGHFDEGGRRGAEKVALRAEKIRHAKAHSEQFRQFFPQISLHNIYYVKVKQIIGTEFLLCIHAYIQQKFALEGNGKVYKCLQMHTFAHYAQSCAQDNKNHSTALLAYRVYITSYDKIGTNCTKSS